MGLLSCLRPLLPTPTSCSTTSDSPLITEKQRHHGARAERYTALDTTDRLDDLRRLMKDQGLDAYVVPTADAHGSEYVGDCDKRRAYISGFTGSAGVALITLEQALLFTDSRYYEQATKELDGNWKLMKVGMEGVKNWDKWVLELKKGSKVGIDPTLVDYSTTKPLLASFSSASLSLIFPPTNLIDTIWSTSRPSRSHSLISVHPLQFTGQSLPSKLSSLRTSLSSLSPSPTSHLLTTLPSIAYFLNLRASDISFNPVFYAYVLIHLDPSKGFIVWAQVRDGAVSEEARRSVEEAGGEWREYEGAVGELKGEVGEEGKVAVDGKVSWAIVEAVGEENIKVLDVSPVAKAQAVKNEVEIEGFRKAYLRDAVAWARWNAWLEYSIKKEKKEINEWDAAEKLTEFRKRGEHFAGLAYENISATGENAALPHYAPTSTSSSLINTSTPYLNDSGAQYHDATIDCTRTQHFGVPSSEQKRAFTRVLQGHIAIDSLVFPEGTTGLMIDVLARRELWKEGMNYMHGTGHGVGQYLSVHEGPQGIGSSLAFQATPFVPGHIMSNEPGYYEAGSYGIRIESIIVVKEVKTRREFGDRKWLGFERFTMVPIDRTLVDYKLLTKGERKWLDEHNELCKKKVLGLLDQGDEVDKRAKKWLRRQ